MHVIKSISFYITQVIALLLTILSTAITCHAQTCPTASSGLVTIALANRRFPIRDAATVLEASPHPSFTVLLRAFGARYNRIEKLLDLIDSPCATVIIYGDCGPCRSPRRPRGLFSLVLPHLDINALNRALERRDPQVMATLKREYESILPHMPTRDGVAYIFHPSLEDNFSEGAWKTAEEIAKAVFGTRKDVTVGRNPVLDRPGPTPREVHTYSAQALSQLKPGDIVTGDGEDLCFPGEPCVVNTRSVRWLVARARREGKHVLLWRPEHQGLPRNVTSFTPVTKRRFKITNIPHLQTLLLGGDL